MKTYKVTVDDYGTIRWYNEQGQFHRENGPAVEWANGSKFWYLNDQRHREDGPAVEWDDGNKEWYLNGKLHREDGPAVEYISGTKSWYLNGEGLTEEEFLKATQPVKELTVAQLEELLGHRVKVVK